MLFYTRKSPKFKHFIYLCNVLYPIASGNSMGILIS
nr:MAG TPA: hypothetical protein [Caudoviricetes sp.]